MCVADLVGLPPVVATLHHRHLVVVGRDAEDSLGVQTAKSWSSKQWVSKLSQHSRGLLCLTEYLVCERRQDPWKTSVWELVLLNIQSLRQSSSEH